MSRLIATALSAAALAFVPTPALAGAQHELYVESYDDSFHLDAEENACGSWSATMHEFRSGTMKVVSAPGGQQDGEFHVNGAVDGRLTIVPDDPSLPTYTGTYREKLNVIVTGFDPEQGDSVRIAQYRLRVPMTGDDGSNRVLALSGKVTITAAGEMVVGRDSATCD